MIPTHIRTAARERIAHIGRRDFLIMGASAAAMKVADVAFDKLVVDPLLDHRVIETYRATPLSLARLETHGGREQRAAREAWALGYELPRMAVERATMTYPGPAGDQWADWQGETASRLLWGGPQPRNVPLRERPDRAFGAWCERRIASLRDRPEPDFVRVRGTISHSNGETDEQDYSILALPLPGGKVLTVSAPWPGTQRAIPGHGSTTHTPGSEVQDRDRLASI